MLCGGGDVPVETFLTLVDLTSLTGGGDKGGEGLRDSISCDSLGGDGPQPVDTFLVVGFTSLTG